MDHKPTELESSGEQITIPEINKNDSPTRIYTPRPFREIPLLWLKIFKMDAAFFENEIEHTSVKNTFLSIMVYSCLYSLLLYFLSYLNSIITPLAEHPFGLATWHFEFSKTSIPFNALVRQPLNLYLCEFLLFQAARLFKGKGTFNEQIYLTMIYAPMVQYIEQIGRFIQTTFPIIAWIVFVPLFGFIFYAMVLGIRSFRIAHGFSSGKAFGVIMVFGFSSFLLYYIVQTLFRLI